MDKCQFCSVPCNFDWCEYTEKKIICPVIKIVTDKLKEKTND